MPAVDDFKTLNKFDQAVLGLGALAFILSFFHFITVSVSGAAGLAGLGGYGHVTAWHGWGFFGMLLVLAATALAAVRIFAPGSMPALPIGINLLTCVLSALGFLFLLIEGLTNQKSAGAAGFKVSEHIGIAGWLLLLVVLAQAAAAFMLFKSSGEVMPDFKAMQANRPAGAVPPPPAPGMTPPPPAATYPPATPAGDFTLDDTNPPTH
jgi:hypothetical protein